MGEYVGTRDKWGDGGFGVGERKGALSVVRCICSFGKRHFCGMYVVLDGVFFCLLGG